MIYEHMKEAMRRDFPRYKRIQVAATVNEVDVVQRKVTSEMRVFGVILHREFDYEKKTIPLKEFTVAYRRLYISKLDRKQMYVAVDEPNKTVYWNYVSLEDIF